MVFSCTEEGLLMEYLLSGRFGESWRLLLLLALLLAEDGTLKHVTNKRTQWVLEPFHFVLPKAPVPDHEGSVHWHIQTPCSSKLLVNSCKNLNHKLKMKTIMKVTQKIK